MNHRCPNCGYNERQERNFMFYTKRIMLHLWLITVTLFAMFGGLAVGNFIFHDAPLGSLFDLGGGYALVMTQLVNFMSESDYNYVSNFTKSIIKNCDDDLCKIEEIYAYVRYDLDYDEGTDLNAVNILKDGEGDCDEKAITFLSMLKTEGIKGNLECSVTDEHCWTRVEYGNRTIIADLTGFKYDLEWKE